MAGVFDPSSFMHTVYEEAGETSFKPVPEGDYVASLGADERDFKIRVNKDGSVGLDMQWYIEDAALAEAMNQSKVRVRQGMLLDLDSNGRLAWGTNQNIRLAQIRAALGQNEAGKAWSPASLRGAGPAMITVKQRQDPTDPERVYSEVTAVNPMKRGRRAA
jgi:hypothetical protein